MTTNPDEVPEPVQVKKSSKVSTTWAFLVIGALILVLLLIFILQNTDNASVNFLGWHFTMQLGVLTLLAAIAGGLIMSFVSGIKLLQLKRAAKKS